MYILLGFLLLTLGGNALVHGSVTVARRLGMSELLIGVTLVGFGTSTPELLTSINAAFAGSPGIAVGNVVGSCTVNILLIFGLAALIAPIACEPKAMKRDGAVLMAATVSCVALALYGTLERLPGLVFIACLVGYVVYTYRQEHGKKTPSAELHIAEAKEIPDGEASLWKGLVLALGGMVVVVIGADLLVEGAIALAKQYGVSESVIGLTVVAVGTSLPEMAAAVMAAIHKKPELTLGNVIGSNIYNIWGILGTTAIIRPIPVPHGIAQFDVWVMLGATALMLVFVRTGHRVSRMEGAGLMGLYAAYIGMMIR